MNKCPCKDCISFAICNTKKTNQSFIDFMLILIFSVPECSTLMKYIDTASAKRHIPGIPETEQYKIALRKIKEIYKYDE